MFWGQMASRHSRHDLFEAFGPWIVMVLDRPWGRPALCPSISQPNEELDVAPRKNAVGASSRFDLPALLSARHR